MITIWTTLYTLWLCFMKLSQRSGLIGNPFGTPPVSQKLILVPILSPTPNFPFLNLHCSLEFILYFRELKLRVSDFWQVGNYTFSSCITFRQCNYRRLMLWWIFDTLAQKSCKKIKCGILKFRQLNIPFPWNYYFPKSFGIALWSF